MTSKGDTFELLAQQYLGDPRTRHVPRRLQQPLARRAAARRHAARRPVHGHAHRRSRPRRCASISLAYFGNDKEAELLRGYNFLDKDHDDAPEGRVDRRADPSREDEGVEGRRARRRRDRSAAPSAIARSTRRRARSPTRAPRGAPATTRACATSCAASTSATSRSACSSRSACCAARPTSRSDSTSDAQGEFEAVLAHKRDAVMHGYEFSPTIRAVWTKAGGASDEN